MLVSVFRIRIGLNTDLYPDPDPAFEVNTDQDPDPAFKVNTDPDPDPDPGFFITNILPIFCLYLTVLIANCFLDLHSGLSESNKSMQTIIQTMKAL